MWRKHLKSTLAADFQCSLGYYHDMHAARYSLDLPFGIVTLYILSSIFSPTPLPLATTVLCFYVVNFLRLHVISEICSICLSESGFSHLA